MQSNLKVKNLSLELVKFVAVILVLNSHMDVLYGKYSALATGGAIGDVLFFFASGFTLFLGRFGSFDNWYKRRIKRIYPSVLAWACVLSFLGLWLVPMNVIVLGGGLWFIKCIMLYYIVLYFVRKRFAKEPVIPFVVASLAVLVWYYFEDSSVLFMYGSTKFKWVHYFLFMLAGAYIGGNVWQFKLKPLFDSLLLIICIVIFYGIQFLAKKSNSLAHFQVSSLLPLMGIVIYTYKLCCWERIASIMKTKGGLFFRFLAGLCLETYIVQGTIINYVYENFTVISPFMVLLTFIFIIVVAYIVRCLARVISQIFEKEDFDWKAVVRLVD